MAYHEHSLSSFSNITLIPNRLLLFMKHLTMLIVKRMFGKDDNTPTVKTFRVTGNVFQKTVNICSKVVL
jgi:hypothetical protein